MGRHSSLQHSAQDPLSLATFASFSLRLLQDAHRLFHLGAHLLLRLQEDEELAVVHLEHHPCDLPGQLGLILGNGREELLTDHLLLESGRGRGQGRSVDGCSGTASHAHALRAAGTCRGALHLLGRHLRPLHLRHHVHWRPHHGHVAAWSPWSHHARAHHAHHAALAAWAAGHHARAGLAHHACHHLLRAASHHAHLLPLTHHAHHGGSLLWHHAHHLCLSHHLLWVAAHHAHAAALAAHAAVHAAHTTHLLHAAHTAHAAHAAHASHAAHATVAAAALWLLLGYLRDDALRGGHQGGDRGGIGERGPDDKGRVDDAVADHVDVLARLRVVALVLIRLCQQVLHNNDTLLPGVLHNGRDGHLQGLLHDILPDVLVEVGELKVLQHFRGVEERGAAARHDPLLHRGPRGVQRVVQAVLHLTYLHFGGATHLDHRDATGELCEALLELVALIRGARTLNGSLDLLAAGLDLILRTCTVQDHGVILGEGDGLCGAEHAGREGVVELPARLLAHQLRTEEHGEVLHHGLAMVAEAWGLHRRHLQATAQLVHNHGRQGLSLDILGDDEEGALHLCGVLEDGQDALHGRNLLVEDEDKGVCQLALLGLVVRYEVRRDETAVKLHALDDLELVLHRLAFGYSDRSILAHFLEGVSDHLADDRVAVGRDGRHLANLLRLGDGLGPLLQVLKHAPHSSVDAALQVHGIHAGHHSLAAFAEDGTGQHRGRRGAIARDIVGLRSDLLDELGSHIHHLALELNSLGDSDAILRHLGRPKGLLNDDVAALRSQGHCHSVSQAVGALEHRSPRGRAMADLLGSKATHAGAESCRHHRSHGGEHCCVEGGPQMGKAG
mmetsp:Transcript_16847/g.37125  ORF Transcript_16847/g.37125 Transcript_16847/m.37125 type:complete len:842 (+) Transcript_16847:26-2551(+)